MSHHILYIPGFGDHMPETQVRILKKWNKFDVEVHFIPIGWSDSEPFEEKLKRVTSLIDKLAGDKKISLVGTSAGGSIALNAYCERRNSVSGVVFICGKLSNAEAVNERFFRRNPAFRKSIYLSQDNVKKLTNADKAKMLTLRSAFDGLIPATDSQIPGAINQVLPFILHIPTIGLALTLFKKRSINFLTGRAGVQ